MKKIIFSVMPMLCVVVNTFAQNVPKISNIEKVEVIKKVGTLVKNEYVFAEVGNIAGKKIEENLKTGKYLVAKDVLQFSEMLTTDLQTITKDEHFRVAFSPEQVEMLKNEKETKNDAEVDPRKLAEGKYYNFAFDELKILEGNIGYLNLTGFFPLSMAKETITAAMNFLSNTDAVIVDLRNNRGGSLDMPPYLASYFLSDEKQTLLQFINRDNKEEDKTETTQQLEGKRLFGKPLYILTSNKTFSAAEAFTYPLKNRNVALTVGEKTGGGANPIVPKVINENFVLGLPTYRPIDPKTATNWEGTGIQPDIEVTADKAKETAHIKALEKMVEKTKNPETKWLVEILKGKYNPAVIDTQTLESYSGKYGVRTITYEINTLCYQKQGQAKIKMIPISETTFSLENNTELKIEMVTENNKVIGFKRVFFDGMTEFSKRD